MDPVQFSLRHHPLSRAILLADTRDPHRFPLKPSSPYPLPRSDTREKSQSALLFPIRARLSTPTAAAATAPPRRHRSSPHHRQRSSLHRRHRSTALTPSLLRPAGGPATHVPATTGGRLHDTPPPSDRRQHRQHPSPLRQAGNPEDLPPRSDRSEQRLCFLLLQRYFASSSKICKNLLVPFVR